MARRQDSTPGPRAAMIDGAISLMRERGVAATSFADVLARSGAPRGSIYHHFPGGKTQLVEEATVSASKWVGTGIERILDTSDTVGALRALVDIWRTGLEESRYEQGCPIAAAALGTERGARVIAGASFDSWCTLLTTKLTGEGVPDERAGSIATLIVSALEGALILAQAQESSAPLDAVVDELEVLCRSAVSSVR
ncbi:TetR/AcrR family transcriptional regulator [Rhodococcus sp. Q]|uniref:TetR/AcrR family transcriptional regulator n=1 Tax=Rhodococcus sp. Q TaxID=2502252 RepID=UPI0010F671FD|nr:TetR/AcrR family transcriptional regulator [Rhodococcus sp. Q]